MSTVNWSNVDEWRACDAAKTNIIKHLRTLTRGRYLQRGGEITQIKELVSQRIYIEYISSVCPLCGRTFFADDVLSVCADCTYSR